MEQQKDLGKLLEDLGCKRSLAQFAWANCTAINAQSSVGAMNLRTRIEFGSGAPPVSRPKPRADGVELWEGPMPVGDAIKVLCSEQPIEFNVGSCRIARSDHLWMGYSPMDLANRYQLGSPTRYIATTASSAGAAGSALKEMLKGAQVASLDGPCFVDGVAAARWWFVDLHERLTADFRAGQIEVHVPLDPGQVKDLVSIEDGRLAVELVAGLSTSDIVVRLATDRDRDGDAETATAEGGRFVFDGAPHDYFTLFVFADGRLHSYCHGHANALAVEPVVGITDSVTDLIREGESEYCEFKELPYGPPEEWETTQWKKLLRSVVAFGNEHGGALLFGVTDEGIVVGIDATLRSLGNGATEAQLDRFTRLLRKQAQNHMRYRPEFRTQAASVDGKLLLVLEVDRNQPGQVSSYDNDVLVRKGSTTRKAWPEELERLYRDAGAGFGRF